MSESFEILMRFPVEGFAFNPEHKEGLLVESPDRHCQISIKPKNPEEDGFGFRFGVEAKLIRHVECSYFQHQFITAFLSGNVQWHPGMKPFPLYSNGRVSVNSSGELQNGVPFWFDWLPDDIKKLIDDALASCWRDYDRLLRLLRWQQNSPFRIADRHVVSVPYWRVNGQGLYHAIPRRSSETYAYSDNGTGCFGWSAAEQADFNQAWFTEQTTEPLAHELRNEAETLLRHAPRSALLMAAAALEVGVKDHISRALPRAEWLIFKVPSPPIYKILRDYLPLLHGSSKKITDWSVLRSLFKSCLALAEDRNSLTHAGVIIDVELIRSHITTVSDVLFLLDYIEGYEWAAEHLSRGIRQVLNLPEPRPLYEKIDIILHSSPDL